MRVYQFITPSRIGGAETHVMDLTAALLRRGHEVTIICPAGRPLTAELRRRGLPLWTPRTWGKGDPLTLLRLTARLRRERVDLLHTHLSTASLLGRLAAQRAGLPMVATVHGFNHATCYRRAPHIIAVSDAVRAHLLAQNLPADRLRVIRNGVDLARFSAAYGPAVRARLGVRANEILIGVVGRLAPEKGQATVIAAAAALVRRESLPLRVALVGEGRSRGALARLARAHRIADRVIFTGFQPETAPYYTALDIVCVPSLKEALSLAAIEGMAAGKPVVASRVGGTAEVIADGETGRLVAPADASALATAIAELLHDPDAARRMGAAGRARAETHFTRERMVDEIEGLYRELAG